MWVVTSWRAGAGRLLRCGANVVWWRLLVMCGRRPDGAAVVDVVPRRLEVMALWSAALVLRQALWAT